MYDSTYIFEKLLQKHMIHQHMLMVVILVMLEVVMKRIGVQFPGGLIEPVEDQLMI